MLNGRIVDGIVVQAHLTTTRRQRSRRRHAWPLVEGETGRKWAVMMFKALVLQTLYTLSDDATEYQLKDRLSFMRFCGLALHDAVPDARRSGSIASSSRPPSLTLFAVSSRLSATRSAS